MWNTILGSIIGALTSLIITHFYYKKAGSELDEQTKMLGKIVNDSQELLESIAKDSEIIRKHSVAGTIDDPEFPYK